MNATSLLTNTDPIQAPAETIAKYSGWYDEGWTALRERRLLTMEKLGILPAGIIPYPLSPDAAAWYKLSPHEMKNAAKQMEVYAAMVDRMDQNVGRLVEYLENTGKYENTIFLFFSDNGPEGNEPDKEIDPLLSAHGKKVLATADNSLESLGSSRSRFWYSSYWGQVGATPFRKYMQYPFEGGTRVPAFIVLPKMKGQGRVSNEFVTVLDVAPTLVEWARARPASSETLLLPFRGRSIVSYLNGTDEVIHNEEAFAMELWGRRAIRRDDWKSVLIPPPEGSGRWMLFNLRDDPGEVQDLADHHTERVAEMAADWERYARDVGVVPGSEPGVCCLSDEFRVKK